MTEEGFYMVHSCTDDHEDNCDAVFVWAGNPDAAAVKGRKFTCDEAAVERMPEADKYHDVLGDLFGNGYGKQGSIVDRAYRAMVFHEGTSTNCDTCGLYEFASIPESRVCRDCLQCGECKCDCE